RRRRRFNALRRRRGERVGCGSCRRRLRVRSRQDQFGIRARMTNTLHRYGSSESFDDDYIVFAIAARGINDQNAGEKQRRFLEIARKYQPVNMGDASHGAIFHSSKELNPTVHWRRDGAGDYDTVVNCVSCPTTVAAVFDDPGPAAAFIKELKAADLGL